MCVSSEDRKNWRQVGVGTKEGNWGLSTSASSSWLRNACYKTAIVSTITICRVVKLALHSLISPQNNPLLWYYYLPFTDEDTEALGNKATCPDHPDTSQYDARVWEESWVHTVTRIRQPRMWQFDLIWLTAQRCQIIRTANGRGWEQNALWLCHILSVYLCVWYRQNDKFQLT